MLLEYLNGANVCGTHCINQGVVDEKGGLGFCMTRHVVYVD